jgi:fatty-acyl-CoA synthase
VLSQATRGDARTLLDALSRHAEAPDGLALAFVAPGAPGEALSRREFADVVARRASGLAAAGARAGDVIVIAQAEGLEAIFAFWGALCIGGIPSMFPSSTEKLDPDVYRANVALMARASGARLAIASDAFAHALSSIAGCPTVGFGQIRESAGAPPPFEPSPDDVAFLQHSSGTTGMQKGVALSHKAVLNQLASYSDCLRLDSRDVIVSWLPLYHDMGLIAGCLLPLFQGVPLVLMSPFDWVKRPALLLRAIHEHAGTLCWLPNFAYNHCARRILDREIEGVSLSRMRAFVNCSEPVLHSSHRAFLDRFGTIGVRPDQMAVSYAMAENVFAVTQTALGSYPHLDLVDRSTLLAEGRAVPVVHGGDGARTNVSCGPPIPGVNVRVAGGLPDRHVGEIQVRSHCMLTGYHGRAELDADIFEDGWYRTGDLGYLADGEVYIVGRKKDLIVTGGRNVYPHDLEAVVDEVQGVHPGRVVAFGVSDESEGTELVVVVAEVETEDPAERSSIAGAIRKTLSQKTGIVANYVELVGPRWLLKTSSGKVARAANRERWLAQWKRRPGLPSTEP